MGNHPLNLTFRFFLEISALIAVGIGGWNISDEWFKYVLVVLCPVIFATIWGVFNVPNDPSRSGKAPVPVSGLVRLLIEVGLFFTAVLALYLIDERSVSVIFLALVIIHYALSYDRINWLMSR